MNCSFDGARRRLAWDFNALADEFVRLRADAKAGGPTDLALRSMGERIEDLRYSVCSLLCMYDDNCEGDMNMLVDEIPLAEINEEDEDN